MVELLEIIWKEAVIEVLYWNVSGETEENLSQNSQCHSRDLKQVPSKYKFRTLLLSHPAWYDKTVRELDRED
jgi:hypothetical protein